MGTALSGYILWCIMGPFKTSYNRDLDVIKSWYLIIVAAVFAVLFHSNLNRSVWADFGWAFSQYLETIAILSQFILFNKKVHFNLIFREGKSKHIQAILLQLRQFLEFYHWYSGCLLTQNWMSIIEANHQVYCQSMLDIGLW